MLRADPHLFRRAMDRKIQQLTQQFDHLSVWPLQDDLSRRRSWQSAVAPGSQGIHYLSPGGLSFTVASYNILAQSLLEEHSDLYEHLEPRFLSWNHRKQMLINEILHYQPDILCLQEVESRHFEDTFRRELEPKGYKGVYKQRTGGKVDGCATFYKLNKFIYERHAEVEFSRQDLGLDRHNIGLLLLLRARNEAQYAGKLCVVNTHLLYNPRRGDIKLAQLVLLLAKIDEVATVSNSVPQQYHPVILCGDLNLEPNSDLFLFLSRGFLQYDGLMQHELSGQVCDFSGRYFQMQSSFLGPQRVLTPKCQFVDILRRRSAFPYSSEFSGFITHDLNLISVYSCCSQSGLYSRRAREASCIQERRPVTVDYVFYSVASKKCSFANDQLQLRGVCEKGLHLINVLKLPTDIDFQDLGKLPTRNLASDHVILLTEFLLHN